MANAKMAILNGLVGLLWVGISVVLFLLGSPDWWWTGFLPLWPALTHLIIVIVYLTDPHYGARMLGKDPVTGRLPWLQFVFFYPWLLAMWGLWFVRHTTCLPAKGENPYDRVAEGLVVGRWPMRLSELPDDTAMILDLTAEFPARPRSLQGRKYRCLPTMDADMPPNDLLLALAAEAASTHGTLYVHCANGHGRSACLAALIMLRRGQAQTWQESFEIMKRNRPFINIQTPQKRMMDELQKALEEQNMIGTAGAALVPSPLEARPAGGIELAATAGAAKPHERLVSASAKPEE